MLERGAVSIALGLIAGCVILVVLGMQMCGDEILLALKGTSYCFCSPLKVLGGN